MTVFKYEIENELKNIEDIGIEYFRKYLDRMTSKYNKIILFKNRDISGYYCTKCKTWHFMPSKRLKHLKRHDYLTCGNCKTRLEIIYQSNVIEDFKDYVTLVQLNYRNELIIRLFFYEKSYNKYFGMFDERFYEVERINLDRKIAMKNNSYRVMGSYYIFHGITAKGWLRDRTGYYDAYYYGNVVTKPYMIKQLINRHEKLKYSCLNIAAKYRIDLIEYIKLWIENPKIELLMKAGCIRLIKDICNHRYYYIKTSILRRLDKSGINMIRKYDMSYKETETYIDLKINDYELLKKAAAINYDNRIKNEIVGILDNMYREEKIISYLYKAGYSVINYKDYIEWCVLLGKNMTDKKIMFPQDPVKMHDKVMKEFALLEDHIYSKKIYDFSKVLEKYDYENKSLIIRPARSQEEMINESVKLKHCVRSYAKKVAKKETGIFFIREKKNENEPYVTLEMKENRIIQCRNKGNHRPNDDVIKFVNAWAKKFDLKSCFRS